MRKISLSVIFAFVLAGSLFAQNRAVTFEHGTLAEALAKAKASSKLVFFDGYTDWCPPCKYMANKVFTQDKVADFFNDKFVSIKVNMEKGEGKELAAKYKIRSLPTFLIIDTEGKEVHRIIGRVEADPFIEMVKQGLDPETSLSKQGERYKNGNRDSQFLLGYFKSLKKVYMQDEAGPVALDYLNTLSEKEKLTKESWAIYQEFANDLVSKDFIFVLSNRSKFGEIAGDSVVREKINNVYITKMVSLLSDSCYRKDGKKAKELVSVYKPTNANRYLSYLKLAEAIASKKGSSMITLCEKLLADKNTPLFESYGVLSHVVPVAVKSSSKTDLNKLLKMVDDKKTGVQFRKVRADFDELRSLLVAKIEGTNSK